MDKIFLSFIANKRTNSLGFSKFFLGYCSLNIDKYKNSIKTLFKYMAYGFLLMNLSFGYGNFIQHICGNISLSNVKLFPSAIFVSGFTSYLSVHAFFMIIRFSRFCTTLHKLSEEYIIVAINKNTEILHLHLYKWKNFMFLQITANFFSSSDENSFHAINFGYHIWYHSLLNTEKFISPLIHSIPTNFFEFLI